MTHTFFSINPGLPLFPNSAPFNPFIHLYLFPNNNTLFPSTHSLHPIRLGGNPIMENVLTYSALLLSFQTFISRLRSKSGHSGLPRTRVDTQAPALLSKFLMLELLTPGEKPHIRLVFFLSSGEGYGLRSSAWSDCP